MFGTNFAVVCMLLLACFGIAMIHAATPVIGIDLGAEFLKVGVVRTGAPINVVLNEQSKRKTPSVIGFRNNQRLFGESALGLNARFPDHIFKYSGLFLGQKYINLKHIHSNSTETAEELLSLYKRLSEGLHIPMKMVRNRERGSSVEYVLPDGTTHYSAEEMVGMILRYVKKLSDMVVPGTNVKDVVIAIPPWYSQIQREAILNAAKIAEFNVLSLMHSTSAIALHYGVSNYRGMRDEWNNKTLNVIFADMGASSSKAVLASFINTGKSTEIGKIVIRGVAWNKNVGGIDMDAILAERFATEFEAKHKLSIRDNARTMTRLVQQATKVKEILSANSDTMAIVESLYEDFDLRMKITRKEFEEAATPIFEKMLEPVKQVASLLPHEEIYSVELLGGASRVPKVQEMLKAHFNRENLGHSLNSDESICLGAAFHAADLSPFFGVKSLSMDDVFGQGIDFALSKTKDQETETIMTLLKPTDLLKAKKTVAIPREEDFSITLRYAKGYIPESFNAVGNLIRADVTGVKSAIDELNNKLEEEKKNAAEGVEILNAKTRVKVNFAVSQSGIIQVESAQAVLERVVKTPETKDKKSKKDKKTSKVDLKVQSHLITELKPMTQEAIQEAFSKLLTIEKFEKKKNDLSKARNDLESLIFNTKYQLFTEEDLKSFYSENLKQGALDAAEHADNWLQERADDETIKTESDIEHAINEYKSQIKNIDDLVSTIYKRQREHFARKKSFDQCKTILATSKNALTDFAKLDHITDEEKEKLANRIEEVETFLESKKKEQEALPLYEESTVSSKLIEETCGPLTLEVYKLKMKPKPKPTVVPANNTTAPSNETKKEEESSEKPTEESKQKTDL